MVVLIRLHKAMCTPRPRPTRGLVATVGVLVLGRAVVEALASHAASIGSGRTAALAADTAHILAGCLWLGAVPSVLVLSLRPTGDGGRLSLLCAARRPFTQLAAASIAIVVVTGLYSAGREVASVGDLVTTAYGRTLLVKTALLALLAALGAINAMRLHQWPRHGPLRRLARGLTRRLIVVESVVGAALLVAVAVLVESAPPRPAVGSWSTAAATAERTQSEHVGDLIVTVSVTPDRPGLNGLNVIAASTRRPAPAAVTGVDVEISQGGPPTTLPLRVVAPGRYFGTARLVAGAANVAVVLHRGATPVRIDLLWQIGDGRATRPARESPLAPIVDVIAGGLIAGCVLVLLIIHRRRPRAGAGSAADDAARDGHPVKVG